MGWFQVANTAHMAGGAGWGAIVSRFPFTRRAVPDPFITFCIIYLTVFGVLIDLDIGMVRAKMTATAGYWFTGFSDIKTVSAVAYGTVADLSVGIDIADTRAGVGFCSGVAGVVHGVVRAVTLHTAGLF